MRQLLTVLLGVFGFTASSFADAPAALNAGPQGFNWGSIGFLAVFFGIFYFLMIRPQSKKAKEHRNLLSQLSQGDEVITLGGILGVVEEVREQFVHVKIANDVVIIIQKQSIASLMPKGTFASS